MPPIPTRTGEIYDKFKAGVHDRRTIVNQTLANTFLNASTAVSICSRVCVAV